MRRSTDRILTTHVGALQRPCGIRAIMSNRAPLTCGVPAGEQCGIAGVPDDHEQSGAVVMDGGRVSQDRCCIDHGDSYRELFVGFRPQRGRDDGISHGMYP
jgi:hypothetical protein